MSTPKVRTIEWLRLINKLGKATAQDFIPLGGRPENISAYMRTHIDTGKVDRARINNQYVYTLTDKGRAYLADEPVTPKADTPKAVTPEPAAPSTLDTAIDNLANALVARITGIVDQKISGIVEGLVTVQVQRSLEKLTDSIAKPKQGKALPRVMVFGLLPDQTQFIKKEFGDVIDVRFVGSNDNASLVKSNATHSDAVFVMGDFISHSSIKLLTSVGIEPRIVKGGMSTLRDALTNFYVEA